MPLGKRKSSVEAEQTYKYSEDLKYFINDYENDLYYLNLKDILSDENDILKVKDCINLCKKGQKKVRSKSKAGGDFSIYAMNDEAGQQRYFIQRSGTMSLGNDRDRGSYKCVKKGIEVFINSSGVLKYNPTLVAISHEFAREEKPMVLEHMNHFGVFCSSKRRSNSHWLRGRRSINYHSPKQKVDTASFYGTSIDKILNCDDIPISDKTNIVIECLKAIREKHSDSISREGSAQGDVKFENIIMFPNEKISLFDPGLSELVSPYKIGCSECITPAYTPSDDHLYSAGSLDIFALLKNLKDQHEEVYDKLISINNSFSDLIDPLKVPKLYDDAINKINLLINSYSSVLRNVRLKETADNKSSSGGSSSNTNLDNNNAGSPSIRSLSDMVDSIKNTDGFNKCLNKSSGNLSSIRIGSW